MKLLQLVKSIYSKEGILHFKRWALIESRWASIYLHKICESDQDRHCHTHPWNFISLILSGGYFEEVPSGAFKLFSSWTLNIKRAEDFHKITLVKKPTWTLVFAGKRRHEWGYWIDDDGFPFRGFIDSISYRQMKNKGEL